MAQKVKKSVFDGAAVETVEMVESEFRDRYPLCADAMDEWRDGGGTGNPVLRVTSKRGAYYRGDLLHTSATVDHLMVGLNPDQVEAILGDPDLVASIASGADPVPAAEPEAPDQTQS